MKIISVEEKIRIVVERWKEQYFVNGKWKWDDDKRIIYERLIREKPTTEKAIENIIGNSTWTSNVCDECGKHKAALIQLGEEPSYESVTAEICHECLSKALSLIELEYKS